MLLAIDIGNTNTVFAAYKGDEQLGAWRIKTDGVRSPDEYAVFLHELFTISELSWDMFHHVIVSSVVPEANAHIERFCAKYLSCTPLFVTKDMVDITLDLERPEDVGADRLVNAVAVLGHYQPPAVVIDFGTATTFDVVDMNGAYAGGVIAPGINLSMHALHQAASKLPKVSVAKPDAVIGKSTTGAMQAGIYFGYKGLIEGIIDGIAEELAVRPYVIATGGLAPLFADGSDVINTVDADLTLKGLQILYAQQEGWS